LKALKVALASVLALAALYGFGRFFLGALGGGRAQSGEPAGVLFAAPPGFVVEQRGELQREAAARALAALLASRPREGRLGLHFTTAGAELYWLVERGDAQAAVLRELAAGQGGTRVETVWRGTDDALERRLAWAAEHGSLDAPGLPPGESRNLYH